MRKITIGVFVLISSFTSYVFGNPHELLNPVTKLENTIVQTQDNLIKNSEVYINNPDKLLQVIKADIVPLIDTKIIAQMVIGQERWKKATIQEQDVLISEATQMLTFMYVNNVAYSGKYSINLFKFKSDGWKSKRLVVVNGKITNNDSKQSSDFAISLFKTKDNTDWKIYNFSISGVSVLDTYKKQFKKYSTVADVNVAIKDIIQNIKDKRAGDLKLSKDND